MAYWYDDPLAAAWMREHFGMLFEGDWPTGENDPTWRGVGGFEAVWCEERYVIHPDSLHLLEPRPGDFGWDAENTFCACYPDGVYSIDWMSRAERPLCIIQRDGFLFHWPKSEP